MTRAVGRPAPHKRWPTAAACAALLVLLGVPPAAVGQPPQAKRNCTPVEAAAELSTAQRDVLAMLDRGTPEASDDLTTLRHESDVSELAALGYTFYPHQQSSVEGMGWSVLDTSTDPAAQTAGRPQLLLYAPTPAPPTTVTEPRDGFDFPYQLRGWGYPTSDYDHAQHPTQIPGLRCMQREQWFVHERGIHTFEDGNFVPYPPVEEVEGPSAHGTTQGDDITSLTTDLKPGDVPHPRMWDLHVWCSPDCAAPTTDLPTVSMLNPGDAIPGLDPIVRSSPPTNWPLGPYPSFYYPIAEGPGVVWEGCNEMIVTAEVRAEKVRQFLPTGFEESGFRLKAMNENPDRAGLLMTARRCDRLWVEGRPQEDTIDAHLSVEVERTEPPESKGQIGPTRVPLDVFMLQYVSNNADFIGWLRRDTGLGDIVRLVDDMVFDFTPSNGVDPEFFFSSPAPAASPAWVSGVVSEPQSSPDAVEPPDLLQLVQDFWALTSRGIVHLISDTRVAEDSRFGSMAYQVTAEEGSPLYEMLEPTTPLEVQGRRNGAFPFGYFDRMHFDKCVHQPEAASFCTGGWTP